MHKTNAQNTPAQASCTAQNGLPLVGYTETDGAGVSWDRAAIRVSIS
jgi:hypothetical protein